MSLDMDSVELILVRHGETDWNVEKRCQGALDVSRLTARGLEQAAEMAQALSGVAAQALYSSGQTRSIQTAEIIAQAVHLPVKVDSRLGEMAQGAWEGMLFPDIERQYGALYQQFQVDPVLALPPGGESMNDLARRVTRAVTGIARQYRGQRVIVVSHEIPLAALRCIDAGQPLSSLWKYAPANGEIIHMAWPTDQPDWFVLLWRWLSYPWRLVRGN